VTDQPAPNTTKLSGLAGYVRSLMVGGPACVTRPRPPFLIE
jgi:hypothetical protein